MPWVSQNASWIGASSPGPGATPSIVVISMPSACTAKARHDRTATPSNSTVQAPHTPCSQPAWAVIVQRDLRGRRHEREVAAPRTDLVEADADMRLTPDREADGGETAGLGQDRRHRSEEEIRRRDVDRAGALPIAQRGAER